MPTYTLWPLRRALSRVLCDTIVTEGLPAINEYLEANMDAATPARITQIGAASVIIGSLPNASQATLEIDQPQQQTRRIATDTFETTLISTLTLSVITAGDNAPEDIKLVGDVVVDNLQDVFNQEAQARLVALHPDGTPYLPQGKPFQECFCYSVLHPKPREKEGDKVTTAARWTLYHTATITYSNLRPDALGL